MHTLQAIGKQGHETSLEKGFLQDAPTNIHNTHDARYVLSYLALIHAEVSEACEEARRGKVHAMGYELADVVLRVTQLCYTMGIDLDQLVMNKLAINKERPHMHGGKLA